MTVHKLQVGSKVIFAKDKTSVVPGPRAKEVAPLAKGDAYSYIVDKYWTVKKVNPDQTAVLVTRRGKEHTVPLDDPRLRRANIWERWFYNHRFPKVSPAND